MNWWLRPRGPIYDIRGYVVPDNASGVTFAEWSRSLPLGGDIWLVRDFALMWPSGDLYTRSTRFTPYINPAGGNSRWPEVEESWHRITRGTVDVFEPQKKMRVMRNVIDKHLQEKGYVRVIEWT